MELKGGLKINMEKEKITDTWGAHFKTKVVGKTKDGWEKVKVIQLPQRKDIWAKMVNKEYEPTW